MKTAANEIQEKKNGFYTIVVITGPTASGKTKLAAQVAAKLNGEIICADSAQVYKDLSIITARTPVQLIKKVPHYLTGFLSIEEDFSVAEFQEKAYSYIQDIKSRGKIPFLVGGTVLYLKSVIEAYRFSEVEPDPDFRKKLKRRAEQQGRKELYRELEKTDPRAAEKIHPNNLPRVIRALEVIEKSGKLYSDLYQKEYPHPLGITPLCFCLDVPREELYNRIDNRVDQMVQLGALEEVKYLVEQGKKEYLLKRRILGSRELLFVLEGYCSLEEGIKFWKRNTRRFAKRQLTWFRSFKNLNMIEVNWGQSRQETKKILEMIKKKLIAFNVN